MSLERQPRKKVQKGFNPSFVGSTNDKAFAERQDEAGISGMHFDNLYDQNEDAAGQKIDERTGKQINNSDGGSPDESAFNVRKISKGQKGQDIMGDIDDEEDDAARWLRANDTKH